jgi:hypothetical protein
MRYIAVLTAVCLFSAVGHCQTSPNTSDSNAAAIKDQSAQPKGQHDPTMNDSEKERKISALFKDAVNFYIEKKYKESCEKWNQIIALLEPNSSNTPEVYSRRCYCLAMWAVEQKDHNLFVRAHDDYEKIKAMALDSKYGVRIRQWQADTGVVLFKAYLEAEMLNKARGMYDELKALAEMHRDEDRMLDRQATNGMRLADAYCKAGKIPEAKALLDEVEPVVKDVPVELIRQELVKWIADLRQKPGMK